MRVDSVSTPVAHPAAEVPTNPLRCLGHLSGQPLSTATQGCQSRSSRSAPQGCGGVSGAGAGPTVVRSRLRRTGRPCRCATGSAVSNLSARPSLRHAPRCVASTGIAAELGKDVLRSRVARRHVRWPHSLHTATWHRTLRRGCRSSSRVSPSLRRPLSRLGSYPPSAIQVLASARRSCILLVASRPVRWSGPRARRNGVQPACVVVPGRSGGPGGVIDPGGRQLDRDDCRVNERRPNSSSSPIPALGRWRSNSALRTRTSHHTPALPLWCNGPATRGFVVRIPRWHARVRGSNPLSSLRHNASSPSALSIVCQRFARKRGC